MASFVLVHGAWHWGGCFQKLGAELMGAGHGVAMPDLASHGFDPTPPEKIADMAQYTASVRRVIEASPEQVILLGHSMGGATCTYLGEQCAEKIAALVYLSAVMVPNGVAPADDPNLRLDPADTHPRIIIPAERGLQLDTSDDDVLIDAFYGDCSAHDIAVAIRNLQPVQALVPFVTPSVVTATRFGGLRRLYIECTQDHAIPIGMQRRMQAASPGAEIFTLDSSHSPFFSQPRKLAEILLLLV